MGYEQLRAAPEAWKASSFHRRTGTTYLRHLELSTFSRRADGTSCFTNLAERARFKGTVDSVRPNPRHERSSRRTPSLRIHTAWRKIYFGNRLEPPLVEHGRASLNSFSSTRSSSTSSKISWGCVFPKRVLSSPVVLQGL